MLTTFRAGAAEILRRDRGWRLRLPPSQRYADAQLDDTQGRRRSTFLHRPPLELSLQARASAGSPPGTLGFGFWNDPFPALGPQAGAGRWVPAAPQALWFFYGSAASDLPFAADAAGSGWRAAGLMVPPLSPSVLAVGGAFLAGFAIPRWRPTLLRRFWGRVAGWQSSPLPGLDQWHEYSIEWAPDRARFRIDGREVLEAAGPPPGPLGIVIWIDNQWAAFSERSGLRFGVTPTNEPAWLDLRQIRLDGRPLDVAG